MDIKKLFQEQENYLIEMRRWFHRHPELSLKEKLTSKKIQEELTGMGIPFEVLAPNYGVVATINGEGGEGKKIVLRADIDALPVQEETGLSFASETKGVMHACGHDAHAAMLLGAAYALNQCKKHFAGTVYCLFQVSEENGQGYQEALEYFETKGIDGFAGLHIWSALPEGDILLIPGTVFAGGYSWKINIHGQGGHGARPDLVHDPIKAACDLVLRLASIPSNFYDVLDHSVVNTGIIQSGTMNNVFPSSAYIEGGMRFYKADGEKKIAECMKKIIRGAEETWQVNCDFEIPGGVPPVINDIKAIEKARLLVNDVDGLAISPQTEPICASDNYGYFLQKYPGFYGILGAGKKDGENWPQHHCKFDIDEKALRKGSEFMTRYALDFLK